MVPTGGNCGVCFLPGSSVMMVTYTLHGAWCIEGAQQGTGRQTHAHIIILSSPEESLKPCLSCKSEATKPRRRRFSSAKDSKPTARELSLASSLLTRQSPAPRLGPRDSKAHSCTTSGWGLQGDSWLPRWTIRLVHTLNPVFGRITKS